MIPNVNLFSSFSLLDLSLILNAEWLRQALVRRYAHSPNMLGAWSASLFAGGVVLLYLGDQVLSAGSVASAVWRAVGKAGVYAAIFCGSSWLKCLWAARGRRRTGAA